MIDWYSYCTFHSFLVICIHIKFYFCQETTDAASGWNWQHQRTQGVEYLEQEQSLSDEPDSGGRCVSQISHQWHQALLLQLFTSKTASPQQYISQSLRRVHRHVRVRTHILVHMLEVIYEVHHFIFAQMCRQLGLAIRWQHNQRASVLIKSTCRHQESSGV